MIQLAVFISASFYGLHLWASGGSPCCHNSEKTHLVHRMDLGCCDRSARCPLNLYVRLTRINPVLGAAGLPTGPLTLRFNSTASWSARKNLDDVLRVGRKLSG